MEMLSEQHALVRKRELSQFRELGDAEFNVAVAEFARERKAARWEWLSCWAAKRAERVRNQ